MLEMLGGGPAAGAGEPAAGGDPAGGAPAGGPATGETSGGGPAAGVAGGGGGPAVGGGLGCTGRVEAMRSQASFSTFLIFCITKLYMVDRGRRPSGAKESRC